MLITSCIGQLHTSGLLNGKAFSVVKIDHSHLLTKTAGCNKALTCSQNTEPTRLFPPCWKTALLEYGMRD